MIKQNKIIHIFLLCASIFLAGGAAFADGELIPIRESGSTDSMLNWVVVGDGFTLAERNDFITQTTMIMEYFLNEEPWKPYKNLINVSGVFVPSNESGADSTCDDIYKDTAFDASYDSVNNDDSDCRLLTVNNTKVFDAVKSLAPYDLIIVIVNDTKYGGSGGTVSVISLHEDSRKLALHEIGHSFAGLALFWNTLTRFNKSNLFHCF